MIRRTVRLGVVGSSLFVLGAALAQETKPSSTHEAAESGTLETITVTARRREENIQDVPVAITALSASELEAKGVSNIEQVRMAVPALQISPSPFGPSVPGYTIRSQRQLEQLISQDPSVGVYFADVVQARPHGSNQSIYDIDSIQVLKGPQGTLFGRNTTGGAVLISPTRPKLNTFEGSVTGLGGNYSLRGGTGIVNLPVGETFALRFGAKVEDRDGYAYNITQHEDLNDSHLYSFRVGALWKPTDGIESYTLADYFWSNTNGSAFSVVAINSSPTGSLSRFFGTTLLPQAQAALARQQARDPLTVENDAPTGDRTRAWGISNNTSFDVGFATLKNIVGYRKVYSDTRLDFDGTPANIFGTHDTVDSNQWSEELQLLGHAWDERISYIVGGYLFRERGRDTQISSVLNAALSSRDGYGDNHSASLFGQADFKLLDKLTLTTGLRQTWDKRELTLFSAVNNLTTCRLLDSAGSPISPCVRKLGPVDFSSTNYLLALNYKILPDVLVYATHSTGYRSGGLNLRASRPGEGAPYDPEKVKNYEIGTKAEFFDHHVRLNAAGYYMDYSDIQRTLTVACPDAPSTLCTSILNAATARVKGYEVEATALPFDLLSLSAFIGYSDAKYKNFVTPTGLNLSGNRFAMAPKTTYGGSAQFTIPTPSDSGKVTTTVSYYHQSDVQIQDINNGGFAGYGLWNASAMWQDIFDKSLDLKLYVNNLTDKRYYTGGVEVLSSAGSQANFVGDPRNYGASLTYRF